MAQSCIDIPIQSHAYTFPDDQLFCLTDFCENIDDYAIQEVHSSFFCGLEILDNHCVIYYPLPGLEEDDFLDIIICETDNATNCESIHISLYIYSPNYSSNSAISGVVWLDNNEDGVQNAYEKGIDNIPLTLKQADGSIYVTHTTRNGQYTFLDIATGNHQVIVGEGPPNSFHTTPKQIIVELAADESFHQAHFGFSLPFEQNCKIDTFHARTSPLSIQRYCIEDFCQNATNLAIQDVQATFRSSIFIRNDHCFEYMSLPGFGGIDTVEVTICETTESANCQTVVVIPYIHDYSYDNVANVLTPTWLLTPEQTLTTIVCIADLGVSPNSYPDFSLPNCPMVQFETLHLADDCFLLTIHQADIPAQDCAIQLCQEAGIICQTHTLTVGIPNEMDQATIRGSVFLDENENGIREEQELGISDVLVDLTFSSGVVLTTQTAPNGHYSFINLPIDTYVVSMEVEKYPDYSVATTATSIRVDLTNNRFFEQAHFGFNIPPSNCFRNTMHVRSLPLVTQTYCLGSFCSNAERLTLQTAAATFLTAVHIINPHCFQYTGLPGLSGVDTTKLNFCSPLDQQNCKVFKVIHHIYQPHYEESTNTLTTEWYLTPQNTLGTLICSSDFIDSNVHFPFLSLTDCFNIVQINDIENECLYLELTTQHLPIQTCTLQACNESQTNCSTVMLQLESPLLTTQTIGGMVWIDKNNDGINNTHEIEGLENIVIYLTLPDGKAIRTTTKEDGRYTFINLFEGTYIITVETAQMNNTLTVPESQISITLAAKESYQTADFGFAVQQDMVAVPTSINNLLNLQITPNPTSHQVAIQLSEHFPQLTYTLTNIQGKIIQRQVPIENKNNLVNVVDLPNGVYFLSVYQEGKKVKTEKLMVVH